MFLLIRSPQDYKEMLRSYGDLRNLIHRVAYVDSLGATNTDPLYYLAFAAIAAAANLPPVEAARAWRQLAPAETIRAAASQADGMADYLRRFHVAQVFGTNLAGPNIPYWEATAYLHVHSYLGMARLFDDEFKEILASLAQLLPPDAYDFSYTKTTARALMTFAHLRGLPPPKPTDTEACRYGHGQNVATFQYFLQAWDEVRRCPPFPESNTASC
jgi:hypothetical protein